MIPMLSQRRVAGGGRWAAIRRFGDSEETLTYLYDTNSPIYSRPSEEHEQE